MTHSRLLQPMLLLLALSFMAGCYPITEVEMVRDTQRATFYTLRTPSKAVMHNGDVILYPQGCAVHADTLVGRGRLFGLTRNDTALTIRKAALADLAALTYYNHYVPGSRVAGTALLGLTGATMLPQSIECLNNPKRCFGSCPTVYTYNDTAAILEAELFSSSISPLYEARDLDRIGSDLAHDGLLQLRITNEALETHYINHFDVVAVRHPAGTACYSGTGNTLCVTGEQVPPSRAINKAGTDVLPLVASAGKGSYRSGDSAFKELAALREFDWVDISVSVPEGASTAALVLRMKNSLLSTVLFYDMVLGSQGIDAVAWTERIGTEPEYAAAFRSVYETFSGISVNVRRDGAWVPVAVTADAGPIQWKESAIEIPVEGGTELTLRLQFFPDNFLIDGVAFSFDEGQPREAEESILRPLSIVDNTGNSRPDALDQIADDDDRYLETNPGDSYRLTYLIPDADGYETTLFLRSKGYYTEWIRGNWVRAEQGDYRFNLYDVPGTLAELSRRWQQDRDFLEQTFFETRIPVREEQ